MPRMHSLSRRTTIDDEEDQYRYRTGIDLADLYLLLLLSTSRSSRQHENTPCDWLSHESVVALAGVHHVRKKKITGMSTPCVLGANSTDRGVTLSVVLCIA
jgi:hypothetical protein